MLTGRLAPACPAEQALWRLLRAAPASRSGNLPDTFRIPPHHRAIRTRWRKDARRPGSSIGQGVGGVATRQQQVHTQLGRAAVQIFAANDRMNQILIEHLDSAACRAKPPEKARTIAAIFIHMHNVRSKWVRGTATDQKIPRQLNRAHCRLQQARAGISQERRSLHGDARRSAQRSWGPRREVSQRRVGSALAGWPGMLCYMISHEAHHRGQVCMLAHQLGFRCRMRWRTGSGIGKSCGKSAVRLAAPATICNEHRAPTVGVVDLQAAAAVSNGRLDHPVLERAART
jgi:uncharacterized damage-inducible protein DinB